MMLSSFSGTDGLSLRGGTGSATVLDEFATSAVDAGGALFGCTTIGVSAGRDAGACSGRGCGASVGAGGAVLSLALLEAEAAVSPFPPPMAPAAPFP